MLFTTFVMIRSWLHRRQERGNLDGIDKGSLFKNPERQIRFLLGLFFVLDVSHFVVGLVGVDDMLVKLPPPPLLLLFFFLVLDILTLILLLSATELVDGLLLLCAYPSARSHIQRILGLCAHVVSPNSARGVFLSLLSVSFRVDILNFVKSVQRLANFTAATMVSNNKAEIVSARFLKS